MQASLGLSRPFNVGAPTPLRPARPLSTIGGALHAKRREMAVAIERPGEPAA